MSWSLELRNGDLTLGGARYGSVTGSRKLLQDLRNHLLERMGTDPSHRGYGSLLDGGVTPEGREINSPIGSTDWGQIALEIEAEIRRIEAEHQAKQLDRIESDRLTYGRSTLSGDEILVSVAEITMNQVQDTLFVNLLIITSDDREITIDIPLGTAPVTT